MKRKKEKKKKTKKKPIFILNFTKNKIRINVTFYRYEVTLLTS